MMGYPSDMADDWDIDERQAPVRMNSAGRAMAAFTPARAFAVLAVTAWAAIGYNAAFRQAGPHPAPLFSVGATRTGIDDDAIADLAQPARTAPANPSGPLRQAAAPAGIEAAEIVRGIQDALNQRGYDVGSVDGVIGPRTRTAIAAFERDAGLAVTGEPSAALLARLNLTPAPSMPAPRDTMRADVPAPHRPAPAPQTVATAIEAARAPVAIPAAARAPEPVGDSSRSVRTTSFRIDDLLAGTAPGGADPALAPRPSMPVGDSLVLQVQSILADLGYSPGRVDGFSGPDTRRAIARFRADRGMQPGEAITADLLAELAGISGVAIQR